MNRSYNMKSSTIGVWLMMSLALGLNACGGGGGPGTGNPGTPGTGGSA